MPSSLDTRLDHNLELIAGYDEEGPREGLCKEPLPVVLDLQAVDAVLEEQSEQAVVRVGREPDRRAAIVIVRARVRRVMVGDECLEAGLEVQGLRDAAAVQP